MTSCTIPNDVRRRLGKIAALMASSADGEALNAMRRTVQMLENHGLRIGDVIERGAAPVVAPPSPPPPATSRAKRAHIQRAERCLCNPTIFSDRETEFLRSILERRNSLTEKQDAWLSALESKFDRGMKGQTT